MKKILLLVLISILFLTGCSNNDKKIDTAGIISYTYAKEMIINNGAVLIDVRTKEEYEEKHIEGAINIPVDDITEESIKESIDSKDKIIIVYCKSGTRSNIATTTLRELGYTEVYDIGAMSNWKE